VRSPGDVSLSVRSGSCNPYGVPVPKRRTFATIALVGVVLYVIVDVLLQVLPPHYSVVSQAESDLAVGPYGWIMAINFFGRGVTSAAAIGAILLTGPRTRLRSWGVILFAVAGLCSALIAFFPTDIAPPGERQRGESGHGMVHLAGASAGFVFALAAFWVLTHWIRRQDALAGIRLPSTIAVVLASVGMLFLAVTLVWTPALFGLAERICLAGILAWVFVVALRLRRA
jgi:hypothetical membrane protein